MIRLHCCVRWVAVVGKPVVEYGLAAAAAVAVVCIVGVDVKTDAAAAVEPIDADSLNEFAAAVVDAVEMIAAVAEANSSSETQTSSQTDSDFVAAAPDSTDAADS